MNKSRHIYDEEWAHAGHRERMRAKFEEHGARIFDTYELVEMLLYYTIPRCDTNPVAKRLLASFGGLEALLSARREALVAVNGVGQSTAELILRVGDLTRPAPDEPDTEEPCLSDANAACALIAAQYSSDDFNGVSFIALGNKMNFLGFEKISPLDLASSAVQPKPFIEAALKFGASACIITHRHASGAYLPDDGDRETLRIIEKALAAVGVRLCESYVLGGGGIFAMLSGTYHTVRSAEYLCTGGGVRELSPVLECALGVGAESFAALSAFPSKRALFSASPHRLTELSSPEVALAVRLFAALAARRVTDELRFGSIYTEEELAPILSALFLDEYAEVVIALSLDGRGRLQAVDRISEGTVNEAQILPRKLTETAKRRRAAALILAHNHPCGTAEPSRDDAEATAALEEVLLSAGIRLAAHYVVAGGAIKRIVAAPK